MLRSSVNMMAAIGLSLLFCLVAMPVQPANAYYTGACVKAPVRHSKGETQYHLRIPHGKSYTYHMEDFPGEVFYDQLESCNVGAFTTTYDVDGNAHVDFTVPAKKWKGMRDNKCNVPAKIDQATRHRHMPTCVEGTPETLADQWRHSWQD